MATMTWRGSMPCWTAAFAALAATTLWLSVPATATEPGLLEATSKDAYSMASLIRGMRTRGADVKVERQSTTRGGQVIQVWVRARPGAFAKVGVYTLMLLTDRHGKVVLERVSENRVHSRHYHFGENALENTYIFALNQSRNHQWGIEVSYVARGRYHAFDWATGRLSGRPPEPHLTLGDLEALWKQASAVLRKAVGQTPVSEEEVLHPGLTCRSITAYTEDCKQEGQVG